MKPLKGTILKTGLISIILIACFVLPNEITETKAAITYLLNFSGKVTNTDGSEVADGVYDFNFRLYTSPIGGSPIWSEDLVSTTTFSGSINTVSIDATSTTYTYNSGATGTSTLRIGQYLNNADTSEADLILGYDTTARTITVSQGSSWSVNENINNRPYVEGGIIDVNLGSVSDISGVDFNQPLYLEVVFNNEIMRPRKILTSVPYAFNAAQLGGQTADQFVNIIDDYTIHGEWTFDNIVRIASSTATSTLTVTQSGSGNIVEFKRGTTTSFAVLNNGQVQFENYTFPLADGFSGYVLKTDGAGHLTWQADSGGGLGYWASSTNNLSIHPTAPDQVVVIGGSATTSAGYIFEVVGSSLFDNVNIDGYLGIGTTSPYAPLSVVGQVVASYFTATSALATSTFPYLSVTQSSLGTIISGSWQGSIIDIAYGGTGTSTAPSYGQLLMGNNLGGYDLVATSSLGLGGAEITRSKFIGTTTAITDGSFSTSTLIGYEAANDICNSEFPGSHFCRTYDILLTIEQGDISNWGIGASDAWIAEGPPGYTSNSNDCNGWTSNSNTDLGAFWVLNSNGGGAGWLVNCENVKPLACCSWQ